MPKAIKQRLNNLRALLKSRAGLCMIASLAITLLLVLGAGLLLRGQEEYVPPNEVSALDSQRSQVYVAGTGYEVDSKQKKLHQEQEEERQKKIEEEPVQPQTTPKTVTIPRNTQTAGPSSRGKPATSPTQKPTEKPTKPGGNKKPSKPENEDPTVPQKDRLPTIKTSIVNGAEVKGSRLDFWVTVTDGYGRNIPVFSEADGSFTVTCNGSPAYSIGTNGTKTSFRVDLADGRNEITIQAVDRKGLTKTMSCWVCGNTAEEAEVVGLVYVSIEAPVLNLGVIYAGTVEIINGDTAKEVLNSAFEAAGIQGSFQGSYLSGIRRQGIASGASISEDVRLAMEDMRVNEKDPADQDPDQLREKDFYNTSGWIYFVNGSSPGVGLGAWQMEDGDELALVFQLADGIY